MPNRFDAADLNRQPTNLRQRAQSSGWTLVQFEKSTRVSEYSTHDFLLPVARNVLQRYGPFSRYHLFMWGRVILGAVIVVLVAVWLAAIFFLLSDPHHWSFAKWPR